MKLWRNPAFVVLWSARTISYVGTGITVVVLPVLVYSLTGSPAWVAAVSAIEAVPYIALGLLAGAMADRLDRKKIMVACDGTAALLLAAVPAAAALHLLVLAQVFIVALGLATVFVWFDAANFGSLPALVDRAQLPAAASLVGSSDNGRTAHRADARCRFAHGTDGAVCSRLRCGELHDVCAAAAVDPAAFRAAAAQAGAAEAYPYGYRRRPALSVASAGDQDDDPFGLLCLPELGGAFALLVVYAHRALGLTHADVRLGFLYSAGELGGLISVAAVPMLIKRWRSAG